MCFSQDVSTYLDKVGPVRQGVDKVRSTVVNESPSQPAAGPSPAGPGRTLRRRTARALPVDPSGRVLLLHGFDPHRPESPFWFTIGGALDDGETLLDAAIRELHEEVGIVAPIDAFSEPFGFGTVEFSFAGIAFVQDQTFFAVAVDNVRISFDHMEPIEQRTTLGHRWWTADELERSAEQYPAELPGMLRTAVSLSESR